MSQIKTFIQEKTPFAVVRYYEMMKGVRETSNSKYELLFLKNNKIVTKELKDSDITILKKAPELKKVLDNQDGAIYEHLSFKNIIIETKPNNLESVIK